MGATPPTQACHRDTALHSPIRWFSNALGMVTNWADALCEPSFATQAVMLIESPTCSESLVKPCRNMICAASHSTFQLTMLPASSFTSTNTNTCGFLHWTVVTVPLSGTGFSASYICVTL